MDMLRHLEKILTADRIQIFLHLAPPFYLVGVLFFYFDRGLIQDPDHGLVLLADYFCYWLASVVALSGAPLDVYNNDVFFSFAPAFFEAEGFLPFLYPPTYLLAVLPFGLFSAWVSHILFFVLSLALLAYVGRLIWGSWTGALIVCAFPAVIGVLIHGQNSFLTAALLGGALVALRADKPVLAGILIGCLTFKPQIGFLIPFVLLAGRYWTTFGTAVITTLVLAALPAAAFGPEIWPAFLEQSKFAASLMNDELVEYWKYLSPFAAFRMLGMPHGIAMVAQVLVGIGCLFWTVRIWRSGAPFDLKAAALVSASVLTSPYMLTYEYVLLVAPMLFLWRFVADKELLAYDTLLYVLAIAFILSARAIADHTGIPVGALPALILLAQTHRYWRRWHQDNAEERLAVTPSAASPAPGG